MLLARMQHSVNTLQQLAKGSSPRFLKNIHRTTTQIANRKFLPGSDGTGFPQILKDPRDDFPKVLKWQEIYTRDLVKDKRDIAELGKDIRPLVDEKITSHPALLLKDLPIMNSDELDTFLGGLGYEYMAYVGGNGVRDALNKTVSTASRDPNVTSIEPHNEMAYLSRWPKLIFLFCETAPRIGCSGETVITDVRDTLRKLDPAVAEKCNRLGIAYLRNVPDKNSSNHWYNSWQESFITDNREGAEKKLAALVTTWKWEKDGSLRTMMIAPAFRPHYRTGEKLWFNQLHTGHASYFKCQPDWADLDIPEEDFPFHTTYGDGSPIESEVVQHVRNVIWDVSVGWQMKRGDLLILDNMYVQHARLGFTGERRILASLSAIDNEYYERHGI